LDHTSIQKFYVNHQMPLQQKSYYNTSPTIKNIKRVMLLFTSVYHTHITSADVTCFKWLTLLFS